MLPQVSFSARVACLLGLMAVAAAVDAWRHGKAAARHREYAFIWIAGIVGGLAGFANDCLTSSISPDYFTLGKGLEPGDGLEWRAGVYGWKAGLSAGLIGGAICLAARAKKAGFSTAQMGCLLRNLWMPLAGAILCGLALPILAARFDPLNLSASLSPLLDAARIAQFRKVWWIHTGLYAGLAVGLAAMILRQRTETRAAPQPVPPINA